MQKDMTWFLFRRSARRDGGQDRKSTRLNSSHLVISYAVFCLKKKRINIICSREGSRNRRRLKANQTGKKFTVVIKTNISTNRNNCITGLDRRLHLHAMNITTIMATIQRINIIGSREGSRNRRRLKANQTGKKFRVGIKSNISTNRNNLISGVDRCIHLNSFYKTTLPTLNPQPFPI